jgi:phage baseplate assembly protein W
MGSVDLSFIRKNDSASNNHLYSDLHLDLVNEYKIHGNFEKNDTQLVDIRISYDIDAIKNSLTAIMSTYPGQRLLLPEFGTNINQFLFSAVSSSNARVIGEMITESIERWEPRIEVREVQIVPVISDHRYDITLNFYVPSLRMDANFGGSILKGEGFVQS